MKIRGFEDLKKQDEAQAAVNSEPQKPKLLWSDEIMTKVNNSKWQGYSPLQAWYFAEKKKKMAGQYNEIDVNEIKAAAKGVKNDWSARYNVDPQKYIPIIEGKPVNWSDIIK